MSNDPISILRQYWGFSSFKGSQENIIEAVLKKQDVLALLPTGGGKSVCFQVPAMAQDGICIVVSPLIALIHDQVNSLKSKGIKAIALTGGISFTELDNLLDNCLYGNYKFLYLSPERLQQELVLERIRQMNVNLIAIDEAHCISQWGHDFRPAYLDCAKLRNYLPETPIIALTATATNKVASDIVDNLEFSEPLIVKDSFSRDNIAFNVIQVEDKKYKLRELCQKTQQSIIVYVRTRRITQEIAQYLSYNKCSADFFHGGITQKEKQAKLEAWLNNKVQVMVATNAFGMGVDKPDVSLVVHYQIPDCIENYFQEAGRAGRNGQRAQAVLLTNKMDEELLKNQFLSSLPDIPFLRRLYNKLNNYFQIAYGEGAGQKFQLNFNAFISTYGLSSFLSYNALRILDQHSAIALSESFSKLTTIQFICNKEQIFDYLESYKNTNTIVQTLLRTYGGIFDFETKINTVLIAKKSNTTEARVLQVLEQLAKDEIISYESQHNDLELTFLVPREDDLTINVFAKQVGELNRTKVEKIEGILKYIDTTDICRSKQLLKYFGEKKAENCGICDICLGENQASFNTQTIQLQIIKALQTKPLSSRALIAHLDYKEEPILRTLRILLENELIRINSKNEYECR
ncbi:ATP-dependent DNA helicase RecQ [Pseudozobellia sp. WGM2]|uniref:RecQ family ATP-dependent DNA helicase n=1 Tax=Pseudozobellia sp. WGM2 TaxID=2787625 RepID=UPI001AE0D8A9|nr:RecQ family ATP-dependent DNA helicase [Pseudozobellia sp. WGM2]